MINILVLILISFSLRQNYTSYSQYISASIAKQILVKKTKGHGTLAKAEKILSFFNNFSDNS